MGSHGEAGTAPVTERGVGSEAGSALGAESGRDGRGRRLRGGWHHPNVETAACWPFASLRQSERATVSGQFVGRSSSSDVYSMP